MGIQRLLSQKVTRKVFCCDMGQLSLTINARNLLQFIAIHDMRWWAGDVWLTGSVSGSVQCVASVSARDFSRVFRCVSKGLMSIGRACRLIDDIRFRHLATYGRVEGVKSSPLWRQ